MTFASRLPWAFLSLAAWWAIALPARAIPLDVPLARLHHSVWTSKEGAPADTWAIAQTRDGWMWFGSPNGLYRFDGASFERVETDVGGDARSRAVSSLLPLDTGELVIGYHNGGVGILRDGVMVNFHEPDGFDNATVFDLLQDADHQLWAATRTGLLRYDGKHWQRLGSASGLPDGSTLELGLDNDGRVWVAMQNRLYYRDAGKTVFEAGPATAQASFLIQSPDGRLWYGTDDQLTPCPFQHPGAAGIHPIRKRTSDMAAFDPDGVLWTVTEGALLRTATEQPLASVNRWAAIPVERLRKMLGDDAVLALSTSAKTMLQARDGSLWWTTISGTVERIRDVPISPRSAVAGHEGSGSIATTLDGAVWLTVQSNFSMATAGDGLWRLDGFTRAVQPEQFPSASLAHVARDGTLRVASAGWLWRRAGERFVRDVALPVGTGANPAIGMADDVDSGSTWVSMFGSGLFLRQGDRWIRNGAVAALPTGEPASLANDAAGTVWLGYGDGRVLSLSHGQVTRNLSTSQARVGAVRIISAGRHVLVGGDRGLAILRGGEFVPVTTDEPVPLESLSGIVELPNGDVWLNGLGGVTRIAADQLEAVLRTGLPVVDVHIFDASDGYPGDGATKSPFGRSMSRAADGRLWFAADVAVASVDPSTTAASRRPVPLLLRSLTTAAGRQDIHGPARLAAGTQGLQVDYTALDYDHPDREHFRYRLAGLDERWTNAGQRRQAFFTNLGPGHYRFEVESRDGVDPWQSTPVTLEIDIPPTFVQSRTFAALCVLAALLSLALLVRARERYLRERERAKLNERLAERERIARELHDTLLQSTQGLALKVQAATSRIRPGEPARAMLDEALKDADQLMVEGRDRIQALRFQSTEANSLESALRRLGDRLAAEHGIEFQIAVQGADRELAPLLSDEVHRIASEALLNAFRHARASRVESELIFGRDDFRLRVRDDGVGIDPQVLRDGHAPGRWGLRGMRERAERVDGTLEVWGAPGVGTEVEFQAPASVAYVGGEAGRAPRWWRRWRANAVRRASGKASG